MRRQGYRWLAAFVSCSLAFGTIFLPVAGTNTLAAEKTETKVESNVSQNTESDIMEETKDDENLVETQADEGDNEVKTKVVVRTDKLKKGDKANEIYQLDDYHVLEFATEKEAKKAIKKYEKADAAYVDYAKKVYAKDTGEADYEYMSWGPESIQSNEFVQKLLDKYGSVENMPEVTVGVIDSGVDYNHKFLKDRMGKCEFDAVDEDDDPLDENHHGTHVAGIIADATLGNVKINAYRCLDADGGGSEEQSAAAILQAVEDGVDVINMSLGGVGFSPLEKAALDKAIENDIVVVVAAGNENTDANMMWPSCYPEAITVAALTQGTDEGDLPSKASYSNFGSVVDVSAPGTDIYSTVLNNKYETMSGTSMATPCVAAAVALLRTYYPEADYQEITNTLEHYALDLGEKGYDEYYGYGEVQLGNADAGLYNDKTLTPVLSEDSNNYDDPIEVSITCDTAGAKIYYTTDGSVPVGKESETEKLYAGPLTIDKSVQIQAIAVSSGLENSSVASAKYYINEEEIESDFYVTEDGTLEGYRGAWGGLNIPETVGGITVKAIADKLFLENQTIYYLSIPDTVEKIGQYAFYAYYIQAIYLGKNVSEIGVRAFYAAGIDPALQEIIVDPDNENFVVEDDVLYSKDKTELIYALPGTLGTSFHIPDTVKKIRQGAFADNTQLKRLYVPSAVENLCVADMSMTYRGVFDMNTAAKVIVDDANPTYSSDENGVLYNKDKTVLYQYPSQIDNEQFVVPDTVKEIDSYAFYNAQVKDVVLPAGLEYIGDYAFANSALKSLTFPDSVSYLGNELFSGCDSLKSFSFDGDCLPVFAKSLFSKSIGEDKLTVYRYKNAKGFAALNTDYYMVEDRTDGTYNTDIVKYTTEAGGILYLNQREKTLISYDGKIGDLNLSVDMAGVTITRVAAGALKGCDSLTSLVIPETVTSIGEYAFSGCTTLASADVSGSVETIPYRAFSGDSILTQINIAAGVKYIADGAFYKSASDEATALKLELPETVMSVGGYAFYQKDALQMITLKSRAALGVHAFSEAANIKYDVKETVPTPTPTETVATPIPIPTETSAQTNETASKTTVKKGTKIKKKNGVYKVLTVDKTRTVEFQKPANKKVKTQVIPATITYQGKTYKVVSIGSKAFCNSKKLKKLTIGKNVKKIGSKAFYGCKKLSSIQVKTKLLKKTKVAGNAFKKLLSNVKVKVVKGGWFPLQ